jgi:hypothetical protein
LGIAEAEIDAFGAGDKAKKHMHISKAEKGRQRQQKTTAKSGQLKLVAVLWELHSILTVRI